MIEFFFNFFKKKIIQNISIFILFVQKICIDLFLQKITSEIYHLLLISFSFFYFNRVSCLVSLKNYPYFSRGNWREEEDKR